MKKMFFIFPALLFAQKDVGVEIIKGRVPIEPKPKAFYYTIDPYQPIGLILGESRFILDPMFFERIEKAVGKSIFLTDEALLRVPVRVEKLVDLDYGAIPLDVSKFVEKGIESWEIEIIDGRGNIFRTITGKGKLPATVFWDGKADDGETVMSIGEIYSFFVKIHRKDGSSAKRVGAPIDLVGLAYKNVVAIKETELAQGIGYPELPKKERNYIQYVINKFREKGFTKMTIAASDIYLADAVKSYMERKLFGVTINTKEVPGITRIEFIFD